LAKDKLWAAIFDKNKALTRIFKLDQLILSNDMNVRKVGTHMGAVLMSRVLSLDLTDISDNDTVMERINQTMLKFVVSQHNRLRNHYDAQIDEVHDRFSEFEK
jgi:hypothetical protein